MPARWLRAVLSTIARVMETHFLSLKLRKMVISSHWEATRLAPQMERLGADRSATHKLRTSMKCFDIVCGGTSVALHGFTAAGPLLIGLSTTSRHLQSVLRIYTASPGIDRHRRAKPLARVPQGKSTTFIILQWLCVMDHPTMLFSIRQWGMAENQRRGHPTLHAQDRLRVRC